MINLVPLVRPGFNEFDTPIGMPVNCGEYLNIYSKAGPLLKNNKLWLGPPFLNLYFKVEVSIERIRI